MSAITTKPLTMGQLNHILDGLEAEQNWNYLAITLLLMKATRVGDLLTTITIGDIWDQDGQIRENLEYSEGKTGKKRIIPIKGDRLIRALNEVYKMVHKRATTDNVFYSRKAKGRFTNSPISNLAVNQNLQKFVGQCKITEVSSHAIRKTACRMLFESGVPIEVISELLNHSDSRTTRTYICVTSKDVSKALTLLEF